ncbi:MAG TPA: methionyl-tRNA formyltransferase [Desulfotomaculum sp.]|nr:MAG: Uncharacterized protein XD78_0831 [Desulfotomaculum sp. 46_296]HAG10719.1 methionyl-tRNA formyltransferase [Desulfotomaculum sp.]
MALLHPSSFDKIEKYRNMVHKPATASYTVFNVNGQTFFQIDTYGTKERVMPDKVSQSIQLDKNMAELLVKMLCYEFHLD